MCGADGRVWDVSSGYPWGGWISVPYIQWVPMGGRVSIGHIQRVTVWGKICEYRMYPVGTRGEDG